MNPIKKLKTPELRKYEVIFRDPVDDATYSTWIEASSEYEAAIRLLALKDSGKLTGQYLV